MRGLWSGFVLAAVGLGAHAAAPNPVVPAGATVQRTAEPVCQPGRGGPVGIDDLRRAVAEERAVSASKESTVLASLDRQLLCPDLPSDTPCVVPGPVSLSCTRLAGAVELRGVVVIGDLLIDRSIIDAGVRLEDVQITGSLRLSGTKIGNGFFAEHVLITGDLLFDNAELREGIEATDLRVLGKLDLAGARLGGAVTIKGALIGHDLDLSPAKAASVTLSSASVIGEASMHDVEISGELKFEHVGLRGSFDTLELVVGGETALSAVAVRDDVSLAGEFKRGVTLDGCSSGLDLAFSEGSVAGALTFNDCKVAGQIYLGEVTVGGNIKIAGSTVEEGADLGTSSVAGELALLNTKFGGPVLIGEAKLSGSPRVVGCTPTDPIQTPDEELQP